MGKTLSFPATGVPFYKLASRIQPAEGLLRKDWEKHPNGGGWVQKTAFVSPTAYVGPYAIVSGNARVLDLARIMDEASITDTAVIAGTAVVEGKARIGGRAKIFGTAWILGEAEIGGEFSLSSGEFRGGIKRPLGAHSRRVARTAQLPFDV